MRTVLIRRIKQPGICLTIASLVLSSCFDGKKFLQQSNLGAGQLSGQIQDSQVIIASATDSGRLQATINGNTNQVQVIKVASGSNLDGASATFPAGALQIQGDVTVTLAEGASLATEHSAQQLGLGTTSDALTSAGTAVMIASGTPIDAAQAFTINLTLDPNASLTDGTDRFAQLIVLYRVRIATGDDKIVTGFIPRSQLVVAADGRSVSFQSFHFGVFQAAYADHAVTEAKQVDTSDTILARSDEPTTPPQFFGLALTGDAAGDGINTQVRASDPAALVNPATGRDFATTAYKIIANGQACNAALAFAAPLPTTASPDLTASGRYQVCVRLQNDVGIAVYGTSKAFVFDVISPVVSAKTVTVTYQYNGDASLHWVAATDDFSPSTSVKYVITQMPSSANTPVFTGTTAVIKGLSPNTQYVFTVTALDEVGNKALYDSVTTKTPVAGPDGLAAKPGVSSVRLSWNPRVGATQYNLRWTTQAGSADGTSIPVDGTTYIHNGLINGQAYYYTVTAVVDGARTLPSAEKSATPSFKPSEVVSYLTTAAGDRTITLTWPTVSGAQSYNLYWMTSGANFNKIVGAQSSYIHSNLTNGNVYSYYVTAVIAGSEGAPSSQVSAVPYSSSYLAVPQGLPGFNSFAQGDIKALGGTPGHLFVATNGGLSRSQSQGLSFETRTSLHGLSSNILRDVLATGDEVLVTTSLGLDVSTNGGDSFVSRSFQGRRIARAGSILVGTLPPTQIVVSNDLGVTSSVYELPDGVLSPVAIAMLNGKIFVATASGLAVSSDLGVTSSLIPSTKGLPSGPVVDVATSGASVVAATPLGIAVSTDSGSTFTTRLPDKDVRSVFVDGMKIWAGTTTGLYVSADNGQTFTTAWTGPSSDVISEIFATGTYEVYFAASSGLYASDNGGVSFSGPITSPNVSSWSRFPCVLGTNLFATVALGLSKSTDNGATFSILDTGAPAGAYMTDLYCANSTIYLPTSKGLGISTDGGNSFTWRTIATFADFPSDYLTRVTTDSTGAIYVATNFGMAISADGGHTFTRYMYGGHNFPDQVLTAIAVADDHTIYIGSNNGLAISTDGGENFANSITTANGLASNQITDILLAGDTIYVGTAAGLSISTDGGQTFATKTTNNGLVSDSVQRLRMINSKLYVSTDGGLSISSDGGQTFTNRTTADGLADSHVSGVVSNGEFIFVGTDSGISRGPLP